MLATFALAAVTAPAAAATVSGQAEVIDGDSVEISSKRIRLFGIDTLEPTKKCDRNGEKWACGLDAADHLRSFFGTASSAETATRSIRMAVRLRYAP